MPRRRQTRTSRGVVTPSGSAPSPLGGREARWLLPTASIVALLAFGWTLMMGDATGDPRERVWVNGQRVDPPMRFEVAPGQQSQLVGAFIDGDFDRAVSVAAAVTEAEPKNVTGWRWLGQSLDRRGAPGDSEAADAAWRRVLAFSTESTGRMGRFAEFSLYNEGLARLRLGDAEDRDDARELLRGLAQSVEELTSGEDPTAMYNLACYRALGGDVEGAFLALERSLGMGFANFSWIRVDPDLERLHDDPRFEAMLRAAQARREVDLLRG